MLIQGLFYALMLLSVAALTIDLGLLRLTQKQMQNAADVGALEGLRGRDGGACDPDLPDYMACMAGDPAALDHARRSFASRLVAAVFTDPTPVTDETHRPVMGAGPVIQFAPSKDTESGFNAYQCYNPDTNQTWDCKDGRPPLPASGAYQPGGADPTQALQPNLTNHPYGDIVSGRFNAGTVDSENCAYDRVDFTSGDASNRSVLVRLRRTELDPSCKGMPGKENDLGQLDNDSGVSASGPRVPLLFGRGTFNQQIGDTSSPRVSGLPVRATSIADARPVTRAGPQGLTIIGLAPFALALEYWGTGPLTLKAQTGQLVDMDVSTGTQWPVGYFYAKSPNGPVSIGDTLAQASACSMSSSPTYIPIVLDLASGVTVGFGYANVVVSCPNITITPVLSQIAPVNATAAKPIPPGTNTQVVFAHHCLSRLKPTDPPVGCDMIVPGNNPYGGLLAPVLVR